MTLLGITRDEVLYRLAHWKTLEVAAEGHYGADDRLTVFYRRKREQSELLLAEVEA